MMENLSNTIFEDDDWYTAYIKSIEITKYYTVNTQYLDNLLKVLQLPYCTSYDFFVAIIVAIIRISTVMIIHHLLYSNDNESFNNTVISLK